VELSPDLLIDALLKGAGSHPKVIASPVFRTMLTIGGLLWGSYKYGQVRGRQAKTEEHDREQDRRLALLEGKPLPMFPLTHRKVSGYKFGKPTWYTLRHLGTDYAATYEPLFAPFDGEILWQGSGPQGGKMLYFRPDHDNVIMRFLHLSQFSAPKGRVAKGQQIAVTGNTGSLTTGPHLHLDINVNPKALLRGDLSFKNFVDPEKYNWAGPTVFIPVRADEVLVKRYDPFDTNLNYLSNNILDAKGKVIGEQPLPEVQRLQSYLIEKGYMKRSDLDWRGQIGAGSGWYGMKTSEAVDRLQKDSDPGPVIKASDSYFGWFWDKTREKANNQLTV
jgi:Membrane proteins related to metalloendopeptidases